MNVDSTTGLLGDARFASSPNCDVRPKDTVIDVLVIHAISLPPGKFGGPGIERLFCNTLDLDEHPYYKDLHELKVSAHLLVRRNGDIVQFVPFHKRAWHAGQSSCEGRAGVNDFSIGIELEGGDDRPFETPQYQALTEVTHAIMEAYPLITRQRIYGHSDISPGRKTDPGPHFDWARYLDSL